WDRAGIETWTPQDGQEYTSLSAWIRAQKAVKLTSLPKNIQALIKVNRGQRTEKQKKDLRDYFVREVYARTRPGLAPLYEKLALAEKDQKKYKKKSPPPLVSNERSNPPPPYILNRGKYEQKTDRGDRNPPASLPPLPAGTPR